MNVIINAIFDGIIEGVVQLMKSTDKCSVAVPDIDERFKKLLVPGGIKASQGMLSDLSTLQRAGDVEFHLSPGSAILKVRLSLGVLETVFEQCKAWYGPVKVKRRSVVTVNTNAFDVQVSIRVKGGCQTSLDFVRTVEMKDVAVDFRKFSGKLLSPLVDVLQKFLHKEVEGIIERELYECLRVEIGKKDLCKLLNLK